MTPWNCPKGYGVCWTCARPCNEPVVPDMALRTASPSQPVATVECTNCAFRYGAEHVEPGHTPEQDCPVCELRASPPPQPEERKP